MLKLRKLAVLGISAIFLQQTVSASEIDKINWMNQSKRDTKAEWQQAQELLDSGGSLSEASNTPSKSSNENSYVGGEYQDLIKQIEDLNALINSVTEKSDTLTKNVEKQVELQKEMVISSTNDVLLKTDRVDLNYHGHAIELSAEDYEGVEHLVMGEAGDQGFIGAALVAQCIRDIMDRDNTTNLEHVRIANRFTGRMNREPNETVKRAVSFIFKQGGVAVQHHIYYFYAPELCSSAFHESQKFIVEYKGHRFFSDW